MSVSFDLAAYMNKATESLIADILRSTLKNPKESAFLLKHRDILKKQLQKKKTNEEAGQLIPTFLISSITNRCNLFCKGCYARANGMCGEEKEEGMLSAAEWMGIFRQAADLGITFNLLAGGEPLLRKDVLEAASDIRELIFPVFTNGTLIDDAYLALFDSHRNLVPVISIEGEQSQTDHRRGDGTYAQLLSIMDMLQKRKLLFGCSVTVTTENLQEVTSKSFLDALYSRGCRLVFYVEYVPVEPNTEMLAPTDADRLLLDEKLMGLRKTCDSMLFLSFPGDEKEMGGCLAAGRGFFHINPYGAAEACPFSPYSDRSLKEHTMLEVLQSPFFQKLRESELNGGEHVGGCALFAADDQVRKLLNT